MIIPGSKGLAGQVAIVHRLIEVERRRLGNDIFAHADVVQGQLPAIPVFPGKCLRHKS